MRIIERYSKNNGRHQVIRVGSGTREYSIVSAEPFPTDTEVQVLWKEQRRKFSPFNGDCGDFTITPSPVMRAVVLAAMGDEDPVTDTDHDEDDRTDHDFPGY